jgi:hypothetical protein
MHEWRDWSKKVSRLGSTRGSRVGWKARPLLHPRYGGGSPKRTLL